MPMTNIMKNLAYFDPFTKPIDGESIYFPFRGTPIVTYLVFFVVDFIWITTFGALLNHCQERKCCCKSKEIDEEEISSHLSLEKGRFYMIYAAEE